MIYNTDFKEQYRIEIDNDIRKHRPDLIPALENGEHIEVASWLTHKEMRII